MSARDATIADVQLWLEENKLGEFKKSFEDNGVDGALLLALSSADMEELGIKSNLQHKKIRVARSNCKPGAAAAKARSEAKDAAAKDKLAKEEAAAAAKKAADEKAAAQAIADSKVKFPEMVAAIKKAPFDSDKTKILTDTVKNWKYAEFTCAQLLTVVELKPFGSDQLAWLKILQPKLGSCTCVELATVINKVQGGDNKVKAVDMLKEDIVDPENFAKLQATCTFDSEKAAMAKLFAKFG